VHVGGHSGGTHTHTITLQPFFWDHPGEPVPEEIFLLTFIVQGKITEAVTLTIRLGATVSGWTISDPPPLSPPFYARCPSCHTLPLYPGLGQAPSIPSGVVTVVVINLRYLRLQNLITLVHSHLRP